MKLAAIYNSMGDSTELLPYSLDSIRGHVDEIIIVYQEVSNNGEYVPYEKLTNYFIETVFCNTVFTYVKYTPDLNISPLRNETQKRNLGLICARQSGCTHFLFMDNDELWDNFGNAKQQYIDSGVNGSVAHILTYFKKPTWRLKNYDNYYVPFIHVLKKDTEAGVKNYPFYVDPTRRVNENDVFCIEIPMHHFSYIRKDIMLKIRNSSARANIENSKILSDYNNPNLGPGYYVTDFRQELIEVENVFKIEI